MKKGEMRVVAENTDDLWSLSQVIDAGDRVSGSTFRKVKLGGEDERNAKVTKKRMTLGISVEKVELQDSQLRILGVIVEGPDDVPRGDHHSFSVEANDAILITKKRWLSFQMKKLKEACEKSSHKTLMVVFDREEAYFALLSRGEAQMLAHIEGNVQKKGDDNAGDGNFYAHIIETIAEYDSRHHFGRIIAASPAFWTEELMKAVADDSLKKRIVTATCSDVGRNGIDEVLKRPELKQALASERIAQETGLVEELLAEVSKQKLAAYGFAQCSGAVEAGAVRILIVTDLLIKKRRETGTFAELEEVMKKAEQMKGEVHLISSSHDAGKRLDGLGGVGALLRYRIQ